jgi:hypothetical protein
VAKLFKGEAALSFRWENVEVTKAELHMTIGSDYRRQPPSSGQAAHTWTEAPLRYASARCCGSATGIL